MLYIVLLLLVGHTIAQTTNLHDAAMSGDLIRLKRLLDSGQYGVNDKDSDGRTALAAAMATCSNVTARFPKTVPRGALAFCKPGISGAVAATLICAGADVNVDVFPKDKPGYKLVHIAACHGSDALEYLLAAGADPNTPYTLPGRGQTVTPLTWAAMCGNLITNETEMGYAGSSITPLLQAGANPLPEGPNSPNTASALIWTRPSPVAKCNRPGNCNPSDVEWLLNDPALHASFPVGYWRQLWKAQEKAFLNPQAKTQLASWVTAGRKGYVCQAAQGAYEFMMENELRRENELNVQYQQKYPLHGAVMANNIVAVKHLLDSGKVQVNAVDDLGLTALQAGMGCGRNATALLECWPMMNASTAYYLMAKGANVNLDVYPQQRPGFTLLHKAAYHGLTRMVQVLLDGGANPNVVYDDTNGEFGSSSSTVNRHRVTPLRAAAKCDPLLSTGEASAGADSTYSTIKELLDAGANLVPFGWETMPTMYFDTPPMLRRCNKIGSCSEKEVLAMAERYPAQAFGRCLKSWLLVWQRLNELSAAIAVQALVG